MRRAGGGTAALVLAADQMSKPPVLAARLGGSGLVSVRVVRNPGASFGIGAGHPVLADVAIRVGAGGAAAVLLCAGAHFRHRLGQRHWPQLRRDAAGSARNG